MSASENPAYNIMICLKNMKEADRMRRAFPHMMSHYTKIYTDNLADTVTDSEKYGLGNMVCDIGGLEVIMNSLEENMYSTHEVVASFKIAASEIAQKATIDIIDHDTRKTANSIAIAEYLSIQPGYKAAEVDAKIASDSYHSAYEIASKFHKELERKILFGQTVTDI